MVFFQNNRRKEKKVYSLKSSYPTPYLLIRIFSFILFPIGFIWPQNLRELPQITGPIIKNEDPVHSISPKKNNPISELHIQANRSSNKKEKLELTKKKLHKSLGGKKAKIQILKGREKKNISTLSPSLALSIKYLDKQTPSIPIKYSIPDYYLPDYYLPDYYHGLYINNYTARKSRRYEKLLTQAHNRQMNVIVADIQPHFPEKKFITKVRQMGFHLVARIVVFPGGIKKSLPTESDLQKIYALIQKSAQNGFNEIQLDYIRFADEKPKRPPSLNISLKERYAYIESILKKVRTQLKPYGIPWGADLFGRVSFNQNDRIGQTIELFSRYADVLYPMLYPSHFYGMPEKIKNPYTTIFTGIKHSIARIKKIEKRTHVVAYIQAFKMKIAPSKLSFTDYIYKQIAGAKDAGGNGYVAWNARNHYTPFFQALDKYRLNRKNLFQK